MIIYMINNDKYTRTKEKALLYVYEWQQQKKKQKVEQKRNNKVNKKSYVEKLIKWVIEQTFSDHKNQIGKNKDIINKKITINIVLCTSSSFED